MKTISRVIYDDCLDTAAQHAVSSNISLKDFLAHCKLAYQKQNKARDRYRSTLRFANTQTFAAPDKD